MAFSVKSRRECKNNNCEKVKITGWVEETLLPGDFSIQRKFNQHYQCQDHKPDFNRNQLDVG